MLANFLAGAWSPYDILAQWPNFVDNMATIRTTLVAQIQRSPDLQGLADACGDQPTRDPPKPSSVKKARQALAKHFGPFGSAG